MKLRESQTIYAFQTEGSTSAFIIGNDVMKEGRGHKGEATGNVWLHSLHNPNRDHISMRDVLLHIWGTTVQPVTQHAICLYLLLPQSYVNLLFWYQFFCGFSGNTMIDYWQMIFFNLFFTSMPPLVFGILDRDVSAETLLGLPELYKNGQNSEVCLNCWSNHLVRPHGIWVCEEEGKRRVSDSPETKWPIYGF